MSGFTHSGKSYLAEKIANSFPYLQFNIVNSEAIHNFLNSTYPVFQDDNTIKGKSFNIRQETTKNIQKELIKTFAKYNINTIIDSCNSTLKKRKTLIDTVKSANPDIKTIIIYVSTPENVILERLQDSDRKNISKGEKPAWVDLYLKVQKPNFEKPTETEADFLIIHKGKLDETLNYLKKVINPKI